MIKSRLLHKPEKIAPSLKFFLDIVQTGKTRKELNYKYEPDFSVLGMVDYNKSQRVAITKAISERISII